MQFSLAAGEGHSFDYTTTTTGTHFGCMQGPVGTNFDLYLKRLDASGAWTTVARSVNGDSAEMVTWTGGPGKFRWRVISASGAGTYLCKIARPN